MTFECPLCKVKPLGKRSKTTFERERSFIAHLGNHKKRGDVFDMDTIRSQAFTPKDDALRDFVSRYAKVLPEISKIQPKRNDVETIMGFITNLCKQRGIKFKCPNCGTKFCPEEGKGIENETRTV